MPFKRRLLPTSQNYTTQEQYDAKIREFEQKLNEIKTSVTVTIEQFDFPDWSKLTVLKEEQTYQFDTNGYLLVGVDGCNDDRWIDTTINGRYIRWKGDYGSFRYGWGCMQLYIPLRRNISFTFKVSDDNLSFAYFLGC